MDEARLREIQERGIRKWAAGKIHAENPVDLLELIFRAGGATPDEFDQDSWRALREHCNAMIDPLTPPSP